MTGVLGDYKGNTNGTLFADEAFVFSELSQPREKISIHRLCHDSAFDDRPGHWALQVRLQKWLEEMVRQESNDGDS